MQIAVVALNFNDFWNYVTSLQETDTVIKSQGVATGKDKIWHYVKDENSCRGTIYDSIEQTSQAGYRNDYNTIMAILRANQSKRRNDENFRLG